MIPVSSSLPPFIDQAINQAISAAVALAASFGLVIPGLPAPATPPAPTPSNGSCEASVIAHDIDVPQMDTVLYCDGQWARVNQDRTDWLITVRWDGQRWFSPSYDGQSWAGMASGCYTREHMDRLGGAPEGVHITYCEPGTSQLY